MKYLSSLLVQIKMKSMQLIFCKHFEIMNVDKILEDLQNIALECGKIHMKYYNVDHIDFTTKTSFCDILTKADLESDAYIRSQIDKLYPNAGIITEEGENKQPTKCDMDEIWFCADPLDGTANFASYFPNFCVSIGVLDKNHKPIAGVVYHPTRDELFIGAKGKGAYLIHNGTKRQLHCSKATDIKNQVITTILLANYSEYYLSELSTVLKVANDFRESGSCASDLCNIAAGRSPGFYGYGPHAWDLAGAWPIIEEAGAVIVNYDGVEFSRKNLHIPRLGIVAGPPEIVKQLVEITSKFGEKPF